MKSIKSLEWAATKNAATQLNGSAEIGDYKTYGNGGAMELTASTFALVKELGEFSYELSSLDCVCGEWGHPCKYAFREFYSA